MKKLLSSFVILLAAFAAVAQNSFSYQSVIRADGKVLENKSISLRLSIMLDDSICYQEQHAVTTNAYGNVNVSVGEGEPLKGSFDVVPWESMRVMMRIEADVNGGADFTDLGSMQIMPVPYAMYAHRTTTVIQPAEASEEPIFEINDSNGNPMFAVYETGVKVFVEYDESEKAAKSRFAVAGRSAGKEADIDLLTIDESGTLVYVDDDNENKAAKSKFAVAGRPGRKGDQQNNLLAIDGSGSTIYVDENGSKAAKSKFAVAGRPGRKGASDTYFTIDENGTLVYVDDANTSANKAAKSKFAVAGRPGRKGGQQNNMLTIDGSGSTIYVDENGSKAAKSKFAVAGRPGRKGADSQSENMFTIDGDGSTIYVDFNSSDKAAKSKFAVAGRPGRKDAADNVMTVDGDQATFYIDIDGTNENTDKAAKSKFAVAGRPGKGDAEPYFIIDQFGSVIYIDEADSKAAKSRFAVAGRSGKGGDNYFTINRDSTRIYINDAPVADTTTGEVVVPSLASGFAVVGMVQKSDLLAVSKDSTVIKIDTYVAEEVQSVSGDVSKIIDDSKADKSYSSGALYLPLVKSEGGMTTRKKFLINYTYYHSDNGEYLYLKTQFKSGSDLINTIRNYYIVDGQVYGDNTYYVKYIEAGEPTIMPYSEVNPDFKEKLKLNLKSDNDLLVILESTMRDSAYSALAEDGRTAFYSPNGDHGKVMESERNIVAMMNDSARSLFTGNLNVFYSLLDTAVRVTQTVGMSYLTSLQWNYGTVSDFYNIDLSDYYYTLYDGDITDENIKITENYQDFTMRGDYQRRNLTEIETMFAGLKEGFDINAQPNNAAWGSVEKPATKVNYGDSINLVPVAAEGCIFLGWSDGCTDSVRRIGITGPINYTANFQPATYYVSNKNSNDDFDGFSDQTPLASLSKALEKINGLGKAEASFTINISGLFVNGTTVTIGACAAKSLTIAGTDKQTDGFKINADGNLDAENKSVLCVANSTTKVTLKNLAITGGTRIFGSNGALFVGGEDVNANVLLDSVLITDNSVATEFGGPCGVGIYVETGSMLTIGSGTEIKANKVGRNGAAVYNYGTIVMTGGFVGNNINHDSQSGYSGVWDINNCGEFTIDGDAVMGNVTLDTYNNKTITIGNHFDASADVVANIMWTHDSDVQVLTLPDNLSDDQKRAICAKFDVEPETDIDDNPISYWKVGISGKLEQLGHVVFVVEADSHEGGFYPQPINYITIYEYSLDFGALITKPADPDNDHMYLWYKLDETGQQDVNEFDFTKTITSDEPIIWLLGRVVPTKCYVSFDTKVEDVELATQEVAYGGKLSEQWMQTLQNLQSNQDFKKDGYTFAGWCVEEDLWDSSHKRIIDQRLVPFDFEQPITANVTLIANWVANELYVDVNNGSDNNSGIASNKAFETIQKAIDIVKYWNVTDKDYTINVSGSSDEKVRIGDADQYPYAIAKTITLQGTGENSGLTNNSKNYYTMLKVGPNNEVVINNFKFNPVGEIYDNKGKAIYVCVNAKVTLSEGTILDGANAGEYQSNNSCYGGGVYVEGGTLVMESDAVIRNFKVKNGGGVYVTYKESYLYDANTGNSSTEYKQGTFTMKGDAVIQNCNGGNGAGVNVGGYPGYQSTFTMEDNAKIEGCTGVGVEVGSDATFNMYGSTRIETCSDRGVEVSSDGTFNMFGNSAIGGSEGKGCTGGLSIYGGEALMNENASISYNTGVANGAGVRVGGGGSFMMTGGTIAYNIAKAEGQYSSGAWGCGVYVETNGKNATEAWTSVFEMRGGSIYGNTATEATPAIYGRGVFVASSYYSNNSTTPFFESTFKLKGGYIAADNDVALQMQKASDDSYMSAKITVGATLADDALVTITPYYTQNNQHQSGLQVLTTIDGAEMQNDKFVVIDQVVGTTTTYWKVDSEGKLAQRTVVTFMNNGTEFAKMPVGNNGKVAEPATKPTSTDKVFTGWYTDAEGTIPFNFNNEVGSTTTTLYAGWGDPEVYVPNAPDGAAGAMTAASLAKAVELINSKDAPDLDWTIKINGQLTGKQVIGGEIAADSITLIGAHNLDANGVPRDMLNGNFTEPTDSAVLNIFATNPVIIKNLKITGGNNQHNEAVETSGNGGGLFVASGANVSLADGAVIAGNKANYGGGVYLNGTLYMYGSAVIGDANATKAPVGESDCSNYASQFGGGVYVSGATGGSFYMGCNSCTMSVVNEQPVYEYSYKVLTGGVFGNRSNNVGGGVYNSSGRVYMNSGIIANNSALNNGGAVRNNTISGFILSGDAYIPAGADFKHDVYLQNGYANVTIDGTLTHEKVAQIMPTKTRPDNSIGYDNMYSELSSLSAENNDTQVAQSEYSKFTITPFVISETAPNTITYYQYTYDNGIKAVANGSAQNIPQFTGITLSDNVFGGDVVTATITGENFTNQMLNFTSICLNDTMVNATFTLESATEIKATFPAPATAGTRTVKVQTYGAEPRTGTLVVNGADPHTFYVKPGGDDTNNDGLTPNTAFASLQKAVESMSDDDAAYTIKVVGALPGKQQLGEMSGFDPVPVAASSIVLTGNGDSDELSGGGSDATLTINTDKPVTITNLTITGGAQGGLMIGEGDVQANVTIAEGVKITGNNGASTSGGGVKVGGNSTLTMTGGEISGNSSESATEDYGGGVIVNGTFNMEGGTIKNNTAENGSGVYVYGSANFSIKGNATIENNDVYLATGATIAIVGALEGTGTVATITPQNYPSATSQVQVLSGEYMADAYNRFAVTEQANSANPDQPIQWEIDSNGYLKKVGGSTSQIYDWMTPDGAGHYYVDLGTGTLWATTNLGAESPEQPGQYFAWGETTARTENFNSDNYQAATVSADLSGTTDAAYVMWGNRWSMPDTLEFKKLLDECYWDWTDDYNSTGGHGCIVYKAKDSDDKGLKWYSGNTPTGSYSLNDAHIFLPAAGFCRNSTKSVEGQQGYYWSASYFNAEGTEALFFTTDIPDNNPDPVVASVDSRMGSYRSDGFTIRPVMRTYFAIRPDATNRFKTIAAAISAINNYNNSEGEYTIDVMAEMTTGIQTSEPIIAKSVTIFSPGRYPIGPVSMNNNTGTTVTLGPCKITDHFSVLGSENVVLENADVIGTSESDGVNVASGQTLTMTYTSVVSGFQKTGEYAMYVNGTLKIKYYSRFENNNSRDIKVNEGGRLIICHSAAPGDVYLASGTTITIGEEGLYEGDGILATIHPASYPYEGGPAIKVLDAEEAGTPLPTNRFKVADNPADGSQWTIDSDGNLKKEGHISYIDEYGVEQTVEAGNYTILLGGEYRTDGSSESNYVIGGECQLAAGTYVVNQDIYTGHLILQGDVKIILCNGATLNIWMYGGNYAIQGENYSLDVYTQTGSTGTLNAHPTSYEGGIKVKNFGFYGGTLYVEGHEYYEIPVIEAKTVTFGYQTVADRIKLRGAKGIPDTTVVKIVSGKMMTDGEHVYSGTLTAEQHTQINNIIEQEGRMATLRPTTSSSAIPEWRVNDGNGHYYVDLDVSTEWATDNVEVLHGFAWGETESYRDKTTWDWIKEDGYAWSSYQFTSDGGVTFSKYNSTSASLESADDAATQVWGTNWRTPTASEFVELFNSCYWVWTDDYFENGGGYSGFIVYKSYDKTLDKQMTKGSNHIYSTVIDAHIFIRKPSMQIGKGSDTEGRYWTSELSGDDVSQARSVGVDNSTGIILDSQPRCYGMQIRPVKSNP